MEVKKAAPKVSVCIMTYNQKKYIGQCLQSLIDQKVEFEYEIIVCDDCSTDGTSEIVQEFADEYKSIIRAFIHKVNIGPYKNYQFAHKQAIGQYVAHLDGDDYALPGKLAAQALVLDRQADVALSTHAVLVEESNQVIGNAKNLPSMGSIYDLLKFGTYFVNSSSMYRRANVFPQDPEKNIIDFYTHIEHASKGKIHLNKIPLGVYRWHPSGISKNPEYQDRIEDSYEKAFDRAIELDVSENIVQTARLIRRKSFAVTRLLSGDIQGFRRKIYITPREYKYATPKHLALNFVRYFMRGKVSVAIANRLIAFKIKLNNAK